MRRRLVAGAVLGLTLSGCGEVSAAPPAAPTSSSAAPSAAASAMAASYASATGAPAPLALQPSANPVLDWNALALRITFAAPPDPGREARALAMTQIAVRDALAATEADQAAAAVAAAARAVLVALYPARARELEAAFYAGSAATPAGSRDSAAAVGSKSARSVLAARVGDRANDVVPFTPRAGVGNWRPTPPAMAPALNPGWGRVTPFVIGRGDRFRPAEPYALTSDAYARDFAEVAAIGAVDSTTRTADQTEAAQFWKATGTQEFNALARALAAKDGLSPQRTARLLVELNTAAADAAIAVTDAKYAYQQWRPVTGIREAADDGNPDTSPIPGWLPLVPTPPFPDYVCGHTGLSTAAQVVLEKWFGTGRRHDLSLTSPALPGVTRTWPTFDAIGEEITSARVWGGIHWRASCERGQVLGRQVGEYVLAHSPTA